MHVLSAIGFLIGAKCAQRETCANVYARVWCTRAQHESASFGERMSGPRWKTAHGVDLHISTRRAMRRRGVAEGPREGAA